MKQHLLAQVLLVTCWLGLATLDVTRQKTPFFKDLREFAEKNDQGEILLQAMNKTWHTRKSIRDDFASNVSNGYSILVSAFNEEKMNIAAKGDMLKWAELCNVIILAKYYQFGGKLIDEEIRKREG